MKDNVQNGLDKKVQENITKNVGRDIPDIKVKSARFWKGHKRDIVVGGFLFALSTGGMVYILNKGSDKLIEEWKKQVTPKIEQLEDLAVKSLENVRKNSGKLTQQEKERLDRANSSALSDSTLLSALNPKAIKKINDDLNGYNTLNPNLSEVQKAEHRAELYADILSQARARSSADSASSATAAAKDRDAKRKNRETILTLVEKYRQKTPGFNLLLDYVHIEGERNFSSHKLPWETSRDNSDFMDYTADPSKNIREFLRIKELGEKGYVPKNSVESFFRGEFNNYVAGLNGRDARLKYNILNADDDKIYGIRLKENKVVGIDVLENVVVKSTVPSRETIRQTKIINIPEGWRRFKSYQSDRGGKKWNLINLFHLY